MRRASAFWARDQAAHAEWGVEVSEGASNIVSGEWWTSVFPGLAITFAVLHSISSAMRFRPVSVGADEREPANGRGSHYRLRRSKPPGSERSQPADPGGRLDGPGWREWFGKSLTSLAIIGLLPAGARVLGGRVMMDGEDCFRCLPTGCGECEVRVSG